MNSCRRNCIRIAWDASKTLWAPGRQLMYFANIHIYHCHPSKWWCRCKCLAPTHSFLGHNSSMETTLTPPPHLLLLGTRSITIVFWMGPHCERNRKRTRGCLMFLSWWIAYQMPISFHHKGKETKKLHSLSCQIISCFDILILNPCVRSNQCTIGNQSSNYF